MTVFTIAIKANTRISQYENQWRYQPFKNATG
jgi:hypothetical protein